MSDSATGKSEMRDLSREEIMSALFGHMVIQNTNMALMFLGQMPHPENGERLYDIEAARMFIDQLEMLEAKTKGNLTAEEARLLQQSLMHLRMSFVQAVENPPKTDPARQPAETASQPQVEENPPPAADSTPEESRKRFTKKF